ncbi:hypothetical protein [Streptomyces spectabilis]|uniref:Minor tail protein n=1 Tax=Streptomyces spectabilis TaxID=68270 RepID=A0A5P2X4A6_STRST|nr:hypothetical protein [Streptomyces spectabilis]MBB5108275.1 hypothetical protein [Streptomyces spectabilis]MCI3901035.1 hypothetical protein [Streptomyces spectabilis]QEV58534.1 hypothetical protein CP982_07270 [Streptomyces spectabilis]GGV45577.1 hypothetical protein GCM10010245_71360 [Streptomyces spectabilis]
MAIPGNMLSATTSEIDPNTSGWTPKLNCTLSKGTGGRIGDGCLIVKSVAAGEMQARTVSSYPVTAGTVYQTFGDAAGVVVERIGIRWLTATGTEISVTWSLSTASASATWHRVGVAGAAPAGATQAQVLLSSTPAAGNVNQFWENVYLGLPIRTTGNLFAFGTETAEVDASGWTAEVNAGVTRQVPAVAWAVDNYLVGGHVIAITATGAGNAAAVSTDRPVVTPGTDYRAYIYLNPPTLAADTWVELRYYDVNGNQVSAARSSLVQPSPGQGWYRQRASGIAPANAATCSIAAGINGAAAGQVLRLEGAVVTVAPELQAGTILPYADGSFEQGVAGWTVASGVATISRSTPWGAAYWEGAYALAVTSSTATASVIRSGRFAAPADTSYRAQIIASRSAGSWTSVNVKVRWYDAANVDLGTTGGTSYNLPASDWWAMATDATVPATATQGAIELTVTASASSSGMYVDVAALWEALPLTAVEVVESTASITLTLRELPLDYYISVYREASDGSRTLVRGTSGLLNYTLITSDLLVIEDYEAPIGVPVAYRIELYEPDSTSPSTRSSDTVTIPAGDINLAWLKDPGNPQRNVTVMVQRAPDWQRPIDQTPYRVKGRRNAVVLSSSRGGLEGELTVWTRTDDERAALHWILDSGATLLWQAVPGMGVADMYVSVAQVTEARTGATAMDLWRAWTLPLTETDMPVTTGVGSSAGRTWQDVLAEFDSWQAVLDTYASWEDVLLDRRTG